MKKTILKTIKIILISLLTLILLFVAFLLYHSNIQTIKGDQVIGTYPSPDGTYIVTAYLNSGNMTTDFAVLGRVKNTKTNRLRNIYWKYHCNFAYVRWPNEDTVVINGIVLDVEKDTYKNLDY